MNTSEILIRKTDTEWAAFSNDKRIAGSACRKCVLSLIQNLTKNSTKYTDIRVIGINGEVVSEFKTGVNHVRHN